MLSGITGSNAYLTFLQVAGVYKTLNYIFSTATLPALQTYLNTLGYGTFVVTNLGGGQIKIATAANTFNLENIVYRDSSGSNIKKTAVVTRNCNALAPLSPSQIIQGIIDWLCPLGAEKVTTSEQYTICYADPATQTKKTEVIASGETLPTFLAALVARGCNTIDFIMSLKSVNCATIQGLFAASPNQMGANDFVLGTKQGDCARIYPVELLTRQLAFAAYDQAALDQLAILLQIINGGAICQPFNTFLLSTVLDSPTSDSMAIVVNFTHSEAIAAKVRYARIDQGTTNWSASTQVPIGAVPYIISNVPEGQYIVGITPVYADGRLCGEVTKTTDVCGNINSFSSLYDGTNIVVTYSASSTKVRVRVQYPNGGQFTQIYTAGASPVSITPPEGITGVFNVSIQSVCNENTAWYGPESAPAVFGISPAYNSTVTNNSSIPLSNVIVSVMPGDEGSTTVSNTSLLSPTGVAQFYLADGVYPQISLVSLSAATGWTAYLVTDSGSYILNGSGVFENVDAGGGVQIVIIDTSPV